MSIIAIWFVVSWAAGALGAGLGVAALAIPGVGPLAAAGAIAASAVPEAVGIGAMLGAIGGSLNEVLTKHGVEKEDVAYYNDGLKDGRVLVTVTDAGKVVISFVMSSTGTAGITPLVLEPRLRTNITRKNDRS